MKLLNGRWWWSSFKVTFEWCDATLPHDLAWVHIHRADRLPGFGDHSFCFFFLLNAVVWARVAFLRYWLFVFYWLLNDFNLLVVIDRDRCWFRCFARVFAYIRERLFFTGGVEWHSADRFSSFGDCSFRFLLLLLAIIRARIFLFVTFYFFLARWCICWLKFGDLNLTRLILIFLINPLCLW